MSEAYPHRAETGARGRTIHIHPPLLAAILLMGGLLMHLLAGPHHRVVQFHHLVGLLLVASGVGLSSYAAALFAARDTTKNPYGKPAAFVIVAPYTFTRNPMYLGLTIILLGFALFFASVTMLFAPIAFVVVIDWMVIPQEEHTMEQLFGQLYRDYKNRVWRWLPLPFLAR
jgi:protein-S-isoprenylcysteine O-methyltransferase Ste14